MEDIAPKLLIKIQEEFETRTSNSECIKNYHTLVVNGIANYSEASKAAKELGDILAMAYQNCIHADALPDGRMYYNIAKRVIEPTLENSYSMAADMAADAQEILNGNAGIGIKVIKPSVNKDGINGFLNRISSEENFETIKWILKTPVVNFTMKAVDDTVKTNVELHGEVGLHPKITRKSSGNCCKWCKEVEGTYEYPNVPKDIYRRHDNCDCTVEYDPAIGRMQNVWTKGWKYK